MVCVPINPDSLTLCAHLPIPNPQDEVTCSVDIRQSLLSIQQGLIKLENIPQKVLSKEGRGRGGEGRGRGGEGRGGEGRRGEGRGGEGREGEGRRGEERGGEGRGGEERRGEGMGGEGRGEEGREGREGEGRAEYPVLPSALQYQQHIHIKSTSQPLCSQ